MSKYKVPAQHFYRLHHPRPRFKNQIEDVLVYVASAVSQIGEKSEAQFDDDLRLAIRSYPGNGHRTQKTIENWRTEIDALMGFVIRGDGYAKPSPLALSLATSQNLVDFFRTFALRFQYPGGHMKPRSVADAIMSGVKFHPASYVAKVLLEGRLLMQGKAFGIDKAEATALIWNDLRVTSGRREPKQVATELIANRKLGIAYESDGDITRYAGDVLDYMVLGNLLVRDLAGRYFIAPRNEPGISQVATHPVIFVGYDNLYGFDEVAPIDVAEIEKEWFCFAGEAPPVFATDRDIVDLLAEIDGEVQDSPKVASAILKSLREKLQEGAQVGTKETGNAGENLVLLHELNRLSMNGAANLAKKVKKIPDQYGVGYDIKSFVDASGAHKHIEVKSTISHGELRNKQFTLTRNEWQAAEAQKQSYWVFRVLISTKSVRCFVLHDPVALYKTDSLSATPTKDAGMLISYDESSGDWEELILT